MTAPSVTYRLGTNANLRSGEVDQNFDDLVQYISNRNSGAAAWDDFVLNTYKVWIDVRSYGATGDGSTDDKTDIQEAIDSAPSTGAVIFFPAGTYIVSSAISTKSNLTILGVGPGVTTIKLKDGVMPGAGANGQTIISHQNSGVVGSTDNNIEIRNLTIDGNSANNPDIAAGSGAGISFSYATNIRIFNVEVKNVDGVGGIYFANTISGTETSNVGIHVEHCVVRDTISSTAGGSYGAAMFITAPQTEKAIITNNYCYNNRQGILLEDSPKRSVVGFNLIEKSAASAVGYGIWLNSGSGSGNRNHSNCVIGNIIKFYGTGITQSGDVGTSNIISGNVVDSSSAYGISIETGGSAIDVNQKVVVSNNIVKNTSVGSGIHLGSATQNIIVIGNQCFDDQGVKTQTYGIATDATTLNCVICNNDLNGNATGAGSFAGTTHQIYSNFGYNTALTSGRVPYATSYGALTDASSLTFDGTSLTATGLINITPTTNQLVLGTTRTITLSATQPASLSRTYTFPDAGANANIVMSESSQTLNGALTLSSALTVNPTSNQLVLGATRTVTLTAPTPATSSRTWTIPDISGNGTVAALEGTQTFSGTKTFSAAISITPTTNQLVLGATRTATISAPTPATSSRVYTVPDPGADANFVMSEATATINGTKTFAGQLIGKGTATNDSAASGYIGETQTSSVTSATSWPGATATWVDGTSISLTAGDWDVSATVTALLNGSTLTSWGVGMGTAVSPDNTGISQGVNQFTGLPPTSAADSCISVSPVRYSLSGSTTVYLKLYGAFASGTPQYFGKIYARRVR